jgi:multisubunit Na+/H+ antiporter MnhG subunit
MTEQGVAIALLLGAGVGLEVLCCLGIAVVPTVYDRLHLLGPAGIVAPPLLAAAVVVQEGLSPLGIKAMLVVLLLWVASPVLAHATARAAAVRQSGSWVAPGMDEGEPHP